MEMAKSMLFEKGLPRSFWAEAINTTIYLINRCPTKALNNQTPFETWSLRKPSMNHLKVFRCVCYAQIPKEKRYKLEETSVKYIFLGYSSMSKGYIIWKLKTFLSAEMCCLMKKQKEKLKVMVIQLVVQSKNQFNKKKKKGKKKRKVSRSYNKCIIISSSTSKKMRILHVVYAMCKFYVVEPKNFKETNK